MADATPPNPRPSSSPHDRSALVQAFQDVVRDEQVKRTTPLKPERPASRLPFQIGMIAIAIVLAAILALQPAWLFPKPPTESPALQEASLRVRMYVQIDRIEQFRTAKARLPATLGEAGIDSTGLTYSAGSDSYSLSGVNRGVTLTYTSSQAPKDFLGSSYRLLAQRRRP
jgi:hypothetical protein